MNILITLVVGALAGYIIFRIGFQLGFTTALARMNAIIVQVQGVMQDLNNLQHQWTEDDL
jgi:hypothetical protein